MEQLQLLVLSAYDRTRGLDLDHFDSDGCITEASVRKKLPFAGAACFEGVVRKSEH
jgi:hypothetical protein